MMLVEAKCLLLLINNIDVIVKRGNKFIFVGPNTDNIWVLHINGCIRAEYENSVNLTNFIDTR